MQLPQAATGFFAKASASWITMLHQNSMGMQSWQNKLRGSSVFASMTSNAKTYSTVPVAPPPDADRKGTADLCDVHMPEPVDQICNRKVQVVQPGLFK